MDGTDGCNRWVHNVSPYCLLCLLFAHTCSLVDWRHCRREWQSKTMLSVDMTKHFWTAKRQNSGALCPCAVHTMLSAAAIYPNGRQRRMRWVVRPAGSGWSVHSALCTMALHPEHAVQPLPGLNCFLIVPEVNCTPKFIAIYQPLVSTADFHRESTNKFKLWTATTQLLMLTIVQRIFIWSIIYFARYQECAYRLICSTFKRN